MSENIEFKGGKTKIVAILGGILLGLLLMVAVFYTPKPKLIDPPNSTKSNTVSLTGTVAANTGVAVFDKSGNALVMVQSNDKGEFTLANVPVGEGVTELRLRAVKSGWRVSLPKVIYVTKDTTAPALTLNNISQSTVTGSNTVVSGQAEPGSTVTVNGVKTTVNEDGTWSAAVALQPGSNKVTVSATDSAGNTVTNSETIQYSPTSPTSQTGTVAVTTSTVTLSPGSQAGTSTLAGLNMVNATVVDPSSLGGTTTIPVGTGTTATTSQTSPASPSASAPTPVLPKPVLAIIASANVSNASPNDRSNETIYATVKDNYGNPVTNASVIATVFFKTGSVNYALSHNGNGQYSTSFKLNEKYASGYRVSVEIRASYQGFSSDATTFFTPL